MMNLLEHITFLFNDNDIRNSVFVVFTKWYKDIMTEEEKRIKKSVFKKNT